MKVRGDPQWAMRRRIIIISLLACLGLSIHAVAHSPEMAQAVLPQTALLAGAVIGSYVFGASWERINNVPGGNVVGPYPPHYPDGPSP